ncbi:MAG: DNA helicase II [Wenzhouxiangellaceae bacterium]|nr:DNA helicase II [Wenzhouxiangellaceae bacterium]
MDVSHLLDELNDAQREAVTVGDGHCLVLAGAGSGKTRVLVHRIAWVIQVEHASPMSVLAVTFTNKAANEMRGRVERLLQIPASGLWIGTFHGICHRILRLHADEAGLNPQFQILDSEDQYRLIRRTIREMQLDEGEFPPRQVQGFINARKDDGVRPDHIEHHGNPLTERMVEIYRAYQAACERSGLVDFAELMLRTVELLRGNPNRLAHYRERFGHVMIDEFQDTNTLQYALVRLLAGGEGTRVFVVGDDDQSIYGWRGARVENVQHFVRDFDPRIIRLEQNYRSTKTILEAANRVIDHNTDRMGKNLWTEGEEGDPIRVFAAYNEDEEAEFVIARIQDWLESGRKPSEVGVLYRSNAQSRLFEQALLRADIPYRVYGGLRFFERAEVRDALGYLRLVHNPLDDAAFERIVNVPARGIGERTVAALREAARADERSLWETATRQLSAGALAGRARNALGAFVELITALRQDAEETDLGGIMRRIVERSELIQHYLAREPADRAEARQENLDELVRAAEGFDQPIEDEQAGLDPTASFLTQAALEAGEHQGERWEDCVQLMTLHSAKGLEFPLVFMCGMEEGLFPHQKSTEEPGRLSEERRLAYVGMTRAREQLVLSYAESRRLHGQTMFGRPSRFVGELPGELVEDIRPRLNVSRARAPRDDTGGLPSLGSRVRHAKFGAGTVLSVEGQGDSARIQINFDDAGAKWLVAGYATLEPEA